MVREFKLPDVGEGVAEGELVSWLVEPGDAVSEDQPVAEVETDKALVEVPSPVNGTVKELHWAEGEMVPVGDLFITYNVEGEDPGPADQETRSEADTAGEAGAVDAPESAGDGSAAEAGDAGATGAETGEVETPEGRVFAPPSVRRLARELGVDIAQVDGS
uniref:biotin/lipoyl-containing protein n=1 Tax=Halovivax sp. TaxID=1935978 RepID=UPI0025C48F39